MMLNLVQTIPFLWIHLKHSFQDVLTLKREIRWKRILPIHDFLIKSRRVPVLKRKIPADHGKEDYPHWPDISFKSLIRLPSYHLRGCIARGSAGCFKKLILVVDVRESKIYYFEISVWVEEQVLWLEVTMANSQFVKVLNSAYYLSKVGWSVFFFDSFSLYNEVKKFTTWAVFHDKVEVFWAFDDLV